jgi:hypothetical protein
MFLNKQIKTIDDKDVSEEPVCELIPISFFADIRDQHPDDIE